VSVPHEIRLAQLEDGADKRDLVIRALIIRVDRLQRRLDGETDERPITEEEKAVFGPRDDPGPHDLTPPLPSKPKLHLVPTDSDSAHPDGL